MSLIHERCDSTGSTLTAIGLTPRFWNSPARAAVLPSSVVQTGVKSAGWENSTTQELPAHSWKRIGPSVDSWVKSGAVSPSRKVMAVSLSDVGKALCGPAFDSQTNILL